MSFDPNKLQSEYQRNGAVLLKNVLDKSMLEELARGVDRNRAHPTSRQIDYVKDEQSGEHFFHDAMLIDENPHYRKTVFDSSLADRVAAMMQTQRVIVSNVTVFLRSAGTSRRTRWHRDQPYWPVSGRQCCSTWIPLDSVSRETALEFVAAQLS
ncbi:MAG: phytanoyl-CoA dioxygenase family protein [Pseudomonadota bacterium]